MAFADAPPSPESIFHRLLNKMIDVRPSEVPALAWSWLYIFSLLSSYYIMRPIRDQMGVAGGVNNLQWLFTGTLVGMLLLNLPFSYLVKTFPREKFISISYRFFSANILLFALALYAATPEQTIWIGRVFFSWTSIFNLFVVSIFWQMIVDIFTSEQGKRLFGFIAAGATLGAISGSAFTVSTIEHMEPFYLMVGAALMLEVAVFCVRRLSRLSAALASRPQLDLPQQPIGGTLLGGIRDALSSGYLLNVSLFLLLYAVTSTFLYFQQAAVVSHSFENRAAQTAFFASVDLGVNILTLAVQLFLTGRILKRFGVETTLSLLPLFSVFGFAIVAALPTLSSVVGFQLFRRAGNFAIARPTREVLFTVLPREDRYKAKSFIDTVVYRLGDQIGAWSFALLSTFFNLGLTQVSIVATVISGIWLVNSLWLGRRQDSLAKQQDIEPTTPS
ncbi:MAG: MFS transporter [Bradyrhizobium sp.]|uniref:NTP/NDP exchange transporter n=1 Tax=Bradyrhizobium sp. TaxID=376 RepID=UPI0012050222|nr:MFS transporter [Bradyrhizobium sp.]THD70382.1 MAG: MFS transporter [Bradyrhizobium sp.]